MFSRYGCVSTAERLCLLAQGPGMVRASLCLPARAQVHAGVLGGAEVVVAVLQAQLLVRRFLRGRYVALQVQLHAALHPESTVDSCLELSDT